MSIKSKLIKRAKCRAKKKKQAFSIAEKDIMVSSYCPILGIPLQVNEGHIGGLANSPTLDRKDNDLGYIPGNIWVISQLANQMKSNATAAQLIAFAKWITQEYS